MEISGGQRRPLLRWAGSKRRLLPKLIPFWGNGFKRYVEPFVGSGALFFALEPQTAVLSDINKDLIQALKTVRDTPDAVYEKTRSYPLGKKSFYRLRSLDANKLEPIERAARFLFLNRYCFNGLYRTNAAGKFNVPFSPGGTGELPSLSELASAAKLLRNAELYCGDFEGIVRRTVACGDLVYLDPPYAVGNRRVFRQYGPHTFGLEDMARLNALLTEIDARGASFVLSYADCREARNTFAQWASRRVWTHRNISGFAKHRRRAVELIVTNS